MSYAIIKNIQVQENKVYLTCASNNVYPRTFEKFHCESLTKILIEQGPEALDIEIMQEYENGNFQKGENKYSRALKVLRNMPEYVNFNWRLSGFGEDDPINQARQTEAYKALLLKALKTKPEKVKYLISKIHYTGITIYVKSISSTKMKYTDVKGEAKVFTDKIDLDNVLKTWAFVDGLTPVNLEEPAPVPQKAILQPQAPISTHGQIALF